MDPAIATAALSTVSSAFDKLIGAIVECKKIDAQIAAVRAQAEVEHRRLDVQEKGLELRHKQIMKRIEEHANIIKKKIESSQKLIQSDLETQETYRNHLDRVFDEIIKRETSKEDREFFLTVYREIVQELQNYSCPHLQDAINIMQNSGSICLDDNRRSLKNTKQISSNEEE